MHMRGCLLSANGLQFKVIPVDSSISCFTGSTNCILLWRKGRVVVVDPGGDGGKIVRLLKRKKLTVESYWLTHAHPDHVDGLAELLDAYPAPIRYHHNDGSWMKLSCPLLYHRKRKLFQPFRRRSEIRSGDIVAKVIPTPGHTRGSVCYWLEKESVLITGDTVMNGCVGATIYAGGNTDELTTSIRRLFRCVPEDTVVLPGHGAFTTIGKERQRGEWWKSNEDKGSKGVMAKRYVSLETVEAAFNAVRKELQELGLLSCGSRLDGVNCFHERLSIYGLWHGFCGNAEGLYGNAKEDQDIHIPAVTRSGLWNGDHRVVRDDVRHEFGHALAGKFKKFFHGGIFKEAFGASYGEKKVFVGGDWTNEYVTEYASKMTQEDFAETFMLYMKYKGKMPARYLGKRAIEKKWKTVGRIIREIAALGK